jgi:HK97 family phage prohead protease
MEIKNLINNRFHRTLEIGNSEETETGLRMEIAASSDVPYRRQFGYETLLHTKEAVDYDRVAAGAVPLLYNHKNDEYIGIVEKVWLVPGQLRAVVRLSKNSDLARQIAADIKDGILKSISIGYEINDMREAEPIDEIPQYIATKWTLYEISVVTTPADYIKAGIGRSEEQPQQEEKNMKKRDFGAVMDMVGTLTEEEKLTLIQSLADDLEEVVEQVMDSPEVMEEVAEEAMMKEEMMDEEETMKLMETSEGEVTEEEEMVIAKKKSAPKAKKRSTTGDTMSNPVNGSTNGADNTVRLAELAAKYERTADLATWIKEGRTAESVAMEILETKSNTDKVSGPAIHIKKSETPEFAGAVTSWLRGDNSELAERGIDQARAAGRAISPGTLYLPTNVPMIKSRVTRDGTAYGNSGANLTGKVFLTFEESLREGALLSRIGGQIVSLNDVSSMPFYSTPTVAATFAETGSISDSEVVVGLKNWTPKRIGARYLFSNLLGKLNGTYDFEAELYNDLLAESVRIFDSQSFSGAGGTGMTGISQDTNITALNLSGSMALASASAMIAQVAKNNASVDNSVFVVDHDVYSQMFATQAFGAGSGNSILDIIQSGNQVFRTGYLSRPTAGKAVALFGDFAKVTAATFGAVEIKRDDLTKLATGQTVLNLEMFADTVVRQPASIVKWANITV